MELKEVLDLMTKVANESGTSTPFICGGVPRDKVMNRPLVIEDIDITTGDSSIHILSKAMATATAGQSTFKQMPDNHSQLIFKGFKIDFSTNYLEPRIKEMLAGVGFKNPSLMQQELYSRDFTCNALLMTLDMKTVKDPIALGIQDIKKKVLRTCLPARITLGSDNKRVARVVYMAAKLGFSVDDEIKTWVKKNPQTLVAGSDQEYVSKKLNKAFEYNADISVKLLDEMGLWSYVPMTDKIAPYMSYGVGGLK